MIQSEQPKSEVPTTIVDAVAPWKSAGEDADAALFEQMYPSLRSFAAVWSDSAIEPDDLVQQAVANALRSRALADYENPAAYLRSAIANIAKSEYRRRARFSGKTVDEPSTDNYPSDLLYLELLTPVDRVAVYLIDVEGLSAVDAASYLDCSVSAVRARAYRARRRIRKHLESELRNESER